MVLSRWDSAVVWYLVAVVVLAAAVFATEDANAQSTPPHFQGGGREGVPIAAQQHKAVLIRSAHALWGLDAPVATFAAQVHQESLWRSDARSPAGAQGIAQFMPSTSLWIAQINPNTLAHAEPFNPAWALRAMVVYDKNLFQQNQASHACEQWAMTLSAYNGGQGWVNRDRKLALASGANGLAWFNHVERFNAGRSSSNFKENRNYPRAILLRWEPLYVANNWGKGVCREYSF